MKGAKAVKSNLKVNETPFHVILCRIFIRDCDCTFKELCLLNKNKSECNLVMALQAKVEEQRKQTQSLPAAYYIVRQ